MQRMLAGLTLMLLAGIALVPAARAQATPPPAAPQRTVIVSGEGTVRRSPDMAVLRFGVVTRDNDPARARQRNAEAARNALQAVRKLGVDEKDIRMETLQLQPVQEFDPDRQRMVERGYQATREFVVNLRDLDKLPDVVAQVVADGANRLNGVQYDLQQRDPVRNEALRLAAQAARDKAQILAAALGERLGAPLQVTEQSVDFPRPMFRAAMMEMKAQSADAPIPEAYAAGEIEVRASVQITYLLQ